MAFSFDPASREHPLGGYLVNDPDQVVVALAPHPGQSGMCFALTVDRKGGAYTVGPVAVDPDGNLMGFGEKFSRKFPAPAGQVSAAFDAATRYFEEVTA